MAHTYFQVGEDVELWLGGGGGEQGEEVPPRGGHEVDHLAPRLRLRATDGRQVDLIPARLEVCQLLGWDLLLPIGCVNMR